MGRNKINWAIWYALLILSLVVQILLYYLFTSYWA